MSALKQPPKFVFATSPITSPFGCRLGTITLDRTLDLQLKIHTPGLLVSTSRGVVPHLTRNHTGLTAAIRWINIPFESLCVLLSLIISFLELSGFQLLMRSQAWNKALHSPQFTRARIHYMIFPAIFPISISFRCRQETRLMAKSCQQTAKITFQFAVSGASKRLTTHFIHMWQT